MGWIVIGGILVLVFVAYHMGYDRAWKDINEYNIEKEMVSQLKNIRIKDLLKSPGE